MTRASAQIRLFGRPRAVGDTGVAELDRRSAACVLLLCVEGATSRARLGDLLWPDAEANTQRANLRQLARRLRASVGADVLGSDDPITIALDVDVDVRRFFSLSAINAWRQLSELDGSVLSGMNFDDCPELDEWLTQTRMRIDLIRAHALSAESARLEQSEGSRATIPILLRWLEIDPTSEEAYRRLMRAHFANGDRGSALAVYQVCKATLARLLDVKPSRATVELANEIRGTRSTSAHAVPSVRQPPPLSVLRPPLLIGRQRARDEIEGTLKRGKLALLVGPAGIGKTRLAQDLAAAHPELETHYVGCRPNDRSLPYIYFTRQWRQDLTVHPERSAHMPEWIKKELARILPELGSSPPPLSSDADRLRFFEANLEIAKAYDDPRLMITDDAHHLDRASHELGLYLAMHFVATKSPLRSISTYRWDELDPDARGMLDGLVAAGEAVRTELEALGETDTAELLRAMEATNLTRHADAIHAFTGGNPFYVVETVKALWDRQDARDLPEAVTASEGLRVILARRLAQLSPLALELLRAAAILDEPLRLSLAQGMLAAPQEAIGAAWTELEHGYLRGGTVVHEILRTLVIDTTPLAQRSLLHCRAAEALSALDAHPARIATHWEQAGENDRAIEYLSRAAAHSRRILRDREAAELEERAARLAAVRSR